MNREWLQALAVLTGLMVALVLAYGNISYQQRTANQTRENTAAICALVAAQNQSQATADDKFKATFTVLQQRARARAAADRAAGLANQAQADADSAQLYGLVIQSFHQPKTAAAARVERAIAALGC